MQNLFNAEWDRARALCFTGHRPEALPERGNEQKPGMRALKSALDAAILRALDEGFTTFLAGGARGFDLLAAEAVLRQMAKGANARLFLALPGRDQAEGWSAAETARYGAVLAAAGENVWFAADVCGPDSMRRRNRFLVDHAGKCVAYLTRMRGGTLYTVRYALENGVPVENLAMPARHNSADEPAFSD